MSTSLMYHAFGVRGYTHTGTRYDRGAVHFTVEPKANELRCANCRSRKVIRRGGRERRFRGLPVGPRPVWIYVRIPRVECKVCGAVQQITVSFADGQNSYTKRFARYVIELAQCMTIQDVAEHLGVSWNLVKDLVKAHLKKRFRKPRLKDVRLLAIDEISIGGGHRYLTVVMDLETGAVIFIGQGKGVEALDPFWRRLRSARARIEAVAIDMGRGYIAAVKANLPEALIVFDHFHVIKLMNEKLSDLRREQQAKANAQAKAVLKGTRWLLLKNPENLDHTRDEAKRLRDALELNAPLAAGYYLKEELRQIWNQANKQRAGQYLDGWIERALATGIRQLRQMAYTLTRHRAGILAYYDVQISTGPLEGFNNKIKTLQRQAYGFRDQEFFRLRIFALHETSYRLVG
jgi:transposase